MIKIYGKNCVQEAVKANQGLEKVFILDTEQKKNANWIEQLKNKKIDYEYVSKERMNQLFGASHQGFGGFHKDYPIWDESIIEAIKGEHKRILILDGIMDPHNLGAILRSVDAFGYDAVVLPKNRSCSITETVAHVSTGAIEYIKIAYVNSLSNFVLKLKAKGYWICGTDASGDTLLQNMDIDRDLAVIIGSEGYGMSKTLVHSSDYLIQIPMIGHVNSLNASVSAGIVLSYLRK